MKVKEALKRNYHNDTSDEAPVPVFTVSNMMYMKHRNGYEKSKGPTMGLTEAQILDLCAYIYALPSNGKFATLNHFCRVKVPTIMSLIKMSCSTTTLDRKKHLVGIVNEAEKVSVAIH